MILNALYLETKQFEKAKNESIFLINTLTRVQEHLGLIEKANLKDIIEQA